MKAASTPADLLVPAALILLSAVPVVAGGFRLTELVSGAEVTPENARFAAAPLPVVVHILTVTPYCLLGAFQFSAGLRRSRPGWHRASGRALVPLGLAAALSGLWMTAFYDLPAVDGELFEPLGLIRLVFGMAMAACIVLGCAAIRRRDIARHRAWMMRGYAIGLGAGTQVLTSVPWILLAGPVDESSRALTMAAGWVINAAVAEWVIRRRPVRAGRTLPARG
ncbi:DUF2306 domain-containing protein [Streptomonospora sediminis]